MVEVAAEVAGEAEGGNEIHMVLNPGKYMKTIIATVCAMAIVAHAPSSFAATPSSNIGKKFSSPENAVEALAKAAKAKDRAALREVLGPASEELQMSDKVQADEELTAFADAFDANHQVIRDSDTHATLEVGADGWPLPIPLVQEGGQWFFDTRAGKDEIINRRIGRNELSTLKTVRAYVDAQREYAAHDRDGDHVLEYAQRVVSTAGLKDGLYWSPDVEGDESPIGPLLAVAQREGYLKEGTDERSGPRPFHGYYFKILTRQGSHAPGGKYDYVINGNMIGGFALVAWPVDYGDSGVMTFIINQQGEVYQKDLGSSTESIVKKMDAYDPDSTWTPSPD